MHRSGVRDLRATAQVQGTQSVAASNHVVEAPTQLDACAHVENLQFGTAHELGEGGVREIKATTSTQGVESWHSCCDSLHCTVCNLRAAIQVEHMEATELADGTVR
jgi:hypothetical protein